MQRPLSIVEASQSVKQLGVGQCFFFLIFFLFRFVGEFQDNADPVELTNKCPVNTLCIKREFESLLTTSII